MGQNNAKDDREGRINAAIDNLESMVESAKCKLKDSTIMIENIEKEVHTIKKEKEHFREMILSREGNIQNPNLNSKGFHLQNRSSLSTALITDTVESDGTIRSAILTSYEISKEIQVKETQHKDLEMNIDQLKDKSKLSLGMIEEQSAETDRLRLDLSNLRCENKKLQEKLQEKQLELETIVQNEKTRYQELLSKYKNAEAKTEDMKIRLNKYETDLALKETQYEYLENSVNAELNALRTEKEKSKQKVQRKIAFRCVLKNPQSDQAISGIVSLLQEKLSNIDLVIIPESSRSKDIPLIVIFYHLSRVTDDAKGALSGLDASPDIALVALHPKRELQSSHEAKKMLAAPEFKRLGVIVDISFLSANGIIQNELTSTAVDQLIQFINNFE